MRTVDDDQRLMPHHLEATGHDHFREAFDDQFARHGRGKERLHGRQRHHGIVTLMPAVQWHEHIGVDSGGRAQVDHATTERQLVLQDVEVGAAQEVDGATGRHEAVCELGVGFTDHHRTPRLDDAGLLGGDVQLGRPGVLRVVNADVGDDSHL